MPLEQPQSSNSSAQPFLSPGPLFSRLEHLALTIGIMDGRRKRNWPRPAWLFAGFDNPEPTPLANPHLEALRSYAERCRVLFPRVLPPTTLKELGFTAAHVEAARERVFADALTGTPGR